MTACTYTQHVPGTVPNVLYLFNYLNKNTKYPLYPQGSTTRLHIHSPLLTGLWSQASSLLLKQAPQGLCTECSPFWEYPSPCSFQITPPYPSGPPFRNVTFTSSWKPFLTSTPTPFSGFPFFGMLLATSQFLNVGLTPRPLQWELGVLTFRLPENSLGFPFIRTPSAPRCGHRM